MLLWESVALSFTTRNWIGVVLGAQAMCERGLAAIYLMPYSPRQDPGRAALGTLLRWAREDGFIPQPVLDQVQTLCDRRKVLTHWKLPMDPGTIMRRSIEEPVREDLEFPEQQQHLLAEDAKQAVDTVFAFCFGNQMDMIPRRPGISTQSLGRNVAPTSEA